MLATYHSEKKFKTMYKHLFFDLDHTLWDFDLNAKETLLELYDTYNLVEKGISNPLDFIDIYTEYNHRLWKDYHNGVITKERLRASRFKMTFEHFGLNEEDIPHQFEIDYVAICPTKTNLFPGTHKVLTELKQKYDLHIITNGFLESSELKIGKTGIDAYFKNVFVSEVIGVNKPDVSLFNHALEVANASAKESIMIGDSIEADIIGARNAGMDQVFFNPKNIVHEENVTFEIIHLEELLNIL